MSPTLPSGAWEIWISDPDGSHASQLTFLQAATGTGVPRWSPDGRLIAFTSDAEGQFEIFVVVAAGGRPKNITSHPAFEHVPSFSADGKWIYFSSTRTGNYEIWKVQLAGGDPVQVTRHGGWSPFESAAGAYLYYTQTAAGGSSQPLWRISTSGGQPVKVLDSVDNLRLRSLGNGFVSAEFRIDSDAVDGGVAGWYHLELGMIGDQWKIYAEEKVQPFSRVVPRN